MSYFVDIFSAHSFLSMKNLLVSWNCFLIQFVRICWFRVSRIKKSWNTINFCKIVKLFTFLQSHIYWIEIFWCVVEHWVRFNPFLNIAMVSCLWIRGVRFSVKILLLHFVFWFWKHKVLTRLLIYQVLNSLISIHLFDFFSFWLLNWKSTIDWTSSFHVSFKRVKSFSCFNVIWILLTHIWASTFNWNYFVWSVRK